MIEIIPNWHPIFVHLTVGLFSTAAVFYLIAYLSSRTLFFSTRIVDEFEVVARWCLWVAGLVVIPTVLAGLYAYNTVYHDAVSHVVMTNHRNWALPTAGAIVFLTLWSMWGYYRNKSLTLVFVVAVLLVQGMLVSTAWRGAELVFRYGLGVMSLPNVGGAGHHHDEIGAEPDHPHMENMDGHDHHDHDE